MRRIGSAIFICALWTVSAHSAELCGQPSTAGIRRCERVVTSKVDPTTNWTTITYIDGNKEIVDLSITFSRKLGEPIYASALVGDSMMMLARAITRWPARSHYSPVAERGRRTVGVHPGGQIRVDLI